METRQMHIPRPAQAGSPGEEVQESEAVTRPRLDLDNLRPQYVDGTKPRLDLDNLRPQYVDGTKPRLDLDNLRPQVVTGRKTAKPIPKGFPKGSQWIDDNTLQIPGGRTFIIGPK